MKDEVKLLRHTLGAIIPEKPSDISEQERKTYCSIIFGVWEVLEKDIKNVLWEQILANNEADNYDKLNYGRGVCTGFDILFEKWQQAAKEHEASLLKEE